MVTLVEGAAVTHEAVVGRKVVVALEVVADIWSHISLLVDSTGRGVILESVGLLATLSCRNLICLKYLHVGNYKAAAPLDICCLLSRHFFKLSFKFFWLHCKNSTEM